MIKYYPAFLAFCLFMISQVFSQENLTLNGGFESVTNDYICEANWSTNNQNERVEYYHKIYNWRAPKRCFPCLRKTSTSDVLCNEFNNIHFSHSGDKYGNTIRNEYLVGELSNYLQIGKYYYIEFHVKSVYSGVQDAGIKFFEEVPCQCGFNKFNNSPSPDIKVGTEATNTDWTLVRGVFKSNKKFKYIALGHYNEDNESAIHWDDVVIREVCSEDVYFQNENHKSQFLFQASHFIFSGSNVTNLKPNGDVTVRSDSKTIYRAGNEVNLSPGFRTESGAYFDAQIKPCENNPCSAAQNKQKEVYICGNNSLEIGFPEDQENTIFHNWTPPSNLDNYQSSNPLFTPPNGVGRVIYKDELSSVCGYFRVNSFPPIIQNVNNKVTVLYDSNPSMSPSITLDNVFFNEYNFSYDLTVDYHTQWIKVEVLESTTNSVIHTKLLNRDTDFSCCSISNTYNNSELSQCKDYLIRFSSKNYCFETLASETRNWDINNSLNVNLLPNIFTPNNDGINDNWCIEIEGADTYEIEIYNRWRTLKSSSGRISNYRICLWDGKNNRGRLVSDGVYFFILKLRNDCGEEIVKTGTIKKT
jgi:gliding motility-associated-like protein